MTLFPIPNNVWQRACYIDVDDVDINLHQEERLSERFMENLLSWVHPARHLVRIDVYTLVGREDADLRKQIDYGFVRLRFGKTTM